ncbi:MAG: hypothetical protein WCO88_02750 [Actinomycetota bacterium]|jgi:hypothetical protein
MLVHELIDILKDYPADQEVELVIVAPVGDNEDDDITVDRYPIDGIMPWDDEDTKETVIWLIGGDEEDVEAFLDAMEDDDEDDDHSGHDH